MEDQMKPISKVLTAGIIGAVTSLALVSAAEATSSTTYSKGGFLRSAASWNTSSNILTAGDKREDGWGAYTPWASNQFGGNCYEGGGNGQTESCLVVTIQGASIVYQACAIDGGVIQGCSANKYDTV
jgi:hypothetical protein